MPIRICNICGKEDELKRVRSSQPRCAKCVGAARVKNFSNIRICIKCGDEKEMSTIIKVQNKMCMACRTETRRSVRTTPERIIAYCEDCNKPKFEHVGTKSYKKCRECIAKEKVRAKINKNINKSLKSINTETVTKKKKPRVKKYSPVGYDGRNKVVLTPKVKVIKVIKTEQEMIDEYLKNNEVTKC